MKRLAKLFLWCARFRYDIQIKGLSQLKSGQSYLVLPNHSSLLEPMIIFSLFVPKVHLRPVAISAFANNRFLKCFFDRIGAIAVEESSSKDTQLLASRLNHSLDQLHSALETGILSCFSLQDRLPDRGRNISEPKNQLILHFNLHSQRPKC